MKRLLVSSHFNYFLVIGLAATLFVGLVSSAGPATPKLPKLAITLSVSQPGNGAYFGVGERPTITVDLGKKLVPEDFATLNLYLYGPQDQSRTQTASAMLNASVDRSQRPHHYIDLLTNPDVVNNGNVLSYLLQPVTGEEPGTYTASVWAVLKASSLVQTMELANLQIGTATVETQVVEKNKCAACHEGASNGKTYFHHIDGSTTRPNGSWSLDFVPVQTCKSCHNQEGYAAYTNASGGKTPDPIVRRVHGVHRGKGLKDPFNTDPDTGDFKPYVHVTFPADVRNCTTCHVDDRWKTKPARLACGACHDNVWFGAEDATPTGWENHPGGQQDSDTSCLDCHGSGEGAVMPVAVAHEVLPPAFQYAVELALSPPKNGKFYGRKDSPVATVTVRDTATGEVINPATIMEGVWSRANLFVSGPRSKTVPVLTTAATAHTTSYANNDFRVRTDPAKEDPKVSRSADKISYQLDPIGDLSPGTYTLFVAVRKAASPGGWSFLNFQVRRSPEEPNVATNCMDCHGDTRMHGSYAFNTDICKNCHDYNRQFPGLIGWNSTAKWNGFGASPIVKKVHGVHYGRYLYRPEELNGAEFAEVIFPQDVRNCNKCHSESKAWINNPSPLACLSCHDNPKETVAHVQQWIKDRTPEDPWSGDEFLQCTNCHGPKGWKAIPDVHNISKPYKPPYLREPAP